MNFIYHIPFWKAWENSRKMIPAVFAMLSLFLILFSGCIKNKFKITVDLEAKLSSAYTLSYYASSAKQGLFIESAISIQNGKGEIELATRYPTIVTLSSGAESIYFYAERGDDVEITGKTGDILDCTVGGNSINEEWSQWRLKNVNALRSHSAGEINTAVENYVKENNENPLSTLLLIYYYDRRENNTEFLRLWKTLKGEAAKEKWLSLTSRNDLLTAQPLPQPDFTKRHTLILKSRENGADTIVTGEKTVVLYFWRSGDPDRNIMIDSLRNLRKHNPDSAQFIIADICINPDSLSWSGEIGRDSLYHIVRAWNPVAEADSAIRAVSYTHLRAHETPEHLVCRLLLEKKKKRI